MFTKVLMCWGLSPPISGGVHKEEEFWRCSQKLRCWCFMILHCGLDLNTWRNPLFLGKQSLTCHLMRWWIRTLVAVVVNFGYLGLHKNNCFIYLFQEVAWPTRLALQLEPLSYFSDCSVNPKLTQYLITHYKWSLSQTVFLEDLKWAVILLMLQTIT